MKPMRPEEFASLYDKHEDYWDGRRAEMRRLRHAYLMRFWRREGNYDESLLVETSRAYELVESYIASLFVRDPSVVVKDDIHGNGDPKLAAAVANLWLRKSRSALEDALRLALIYPFAGIKLATRQAGNVLNRVTPSAVSPGTSSSTTPHRAGTSSGIVRTATTCRSKRPRSGTAIASTAPHLRTVHRGRRRRHGRCRRGTTQQWAHEPAARAVRHGGRGL